VIPVYWLLLCSSQGPQRRRSACTVPAGDPQGACPTGRTRPVSQNSTACPPEGGGSSKARSTFARPRDGAGRMAGTELEPGF
jgi:hypothetical protein